jgi:hypothetical protein|tara:strand:- start:800 stop:1102 length:303 start_codon:yes stop_codon:yes gene_type:complete
MSCKFCHYWKKDEIENVFYWDVKTGACGRYPEPLDTSYDHMCGEFLMKTEFLSGESEILDIDRSRKKWFKLYKIAEEKRKKLQKRNKVLNAKIKELKTND